MVADKKGRGLCMRALRDRCEHVVGPRDNVILYSKSGVKVKSVMLGAGGWSHGSGWELHVSHP